MYKEAVAAFEKARSLPGGNPLILGALGHGYAVSGNRREAEKLREELRNLSARRCPSPIGRALIGKGLGDKERAIRLSEPFMKKVVADMDNDWTLTAEEIDRALKSIEAR